MPKSTGTSSTISTGSTGSTASFFDNLKANMFAPVQACIEFAFLPPSDPPATTTAPAAHRSTTRLVPARIRRPPALASHGQTAPKTKTLLSPIAKTSTATRPKKAATGERRRSAKKPYTALTTPTAVGFGFHTKLALGGLRDGWAYRAKTTPEAPATPSGRLAGFLHKALKL